MRTDHALYAVAVIFFIMTGVVLASQPEETKPLGVIATTVLGIFFAGLGYSLRPKTEEEKTITTALKKPEEAAEEAKTAQLGTPLVEVKGIGEKRAEQLKSLGINYAEELAKVSPEDLAAKLKASPKIVQKWIENAKKLTQTKN
ncbi:MAG: helix-hairpin-helix domain-containing protein [Candidatus Bathyarchaeia archaeon]